MAESPDRGRTELGDPRCNDFAHCSEAGLADHHDSSMQDPWVGENIQTIQQLRFLLVTGRGGDGLNRFPAMVFESEIKKQQWQVSGNCTWNGSPTERG